MKIARITLVLLLGIMMVSGLACGVSTKAVNSYQEAYAAQSEYFDSVAQSTQAIATLALYRLVLTNPLCTTHCSAFAEDYEVNYQPLGEDELDKAYCFIIEDKGPITAGLSLGGDPRAAEILDTVAGFAEFEFMVLAEDGTVIPFNRNAMLLMSRLMK